MMPSYDYQSLRTLSRVTSERCIFFCPADQPIDHVIENCSTQTNKLRQNRQSILFVPKVHLSHQLPKMSSTNSVVSFLPKLHLSHQWPEMRSTNTLGKTPYFCQSSTYPTNCPRWDKQDSLGAAFYLCLCSIRPTNCLRWAEQIV